MRSLRLFSRIGQVLKRVARAVPSVKRHEEYKRFIRQIKLLAEGSLFPSNIEWERKWQASPGKRILYFANLDFSGSLYRWADAINRYSDYAVRLITTQPHPYGYSLDIVVPEYIPQSIERLNPGFSAMQERCLRLAGEANVIQYKEEAKLFLDKISGNTASISAKIMQVAELKKTPQVFTLCGSYARKQSTNPDYIAFVSHYPTRIVMTPDLNYEWVDGIYIPHAIDTERYLYSWADGVRVAHSPSRKEVKATWALEEAVNLCRSDGINIELDIISGASHDECMARKMRASVFFDQAGRNNSENGAVVGWYGNSAIEAMAFGVPTIAHLSREAFDRARRAGKDIKSACPILSVECEDGVSLKNSLKSFFSLSASDRKRQSERAREWAVYFHGYKSVAHELIKCYSGLLGYLNKE